MTVTVKPADGRLRYFMSDESDSVRPEIKMQISDNEFFACPLTRDRTAQKTLLHNKAQ